MPRPRNMIAVAFAIAAILAMPSISAAARPAKGRFIYKAGESWKMRDNTSMNMGQGMSLVSAVWQFQVEKLFPDGSALVSRKPLSFRQGSTSTGMVEAQLPAGGQTAYYLADSLGRMFLAQPKMGFSSPEEEAMMGGEKNIDEIALLRGSKTPAKFLKVMRNGGPIDAYRVPAKALKPGGKYGLEGYAAVRLPDEAVNGKPCEVYKSAMSVLTETCWFDARAGRVVRRIITQENEQKLEIRQEVIE